MKKNWIFWTALAVVSAAIFGCKETEQKKDRLSIVATTFPEYDWVKNLVGNSPHFEVTLLEKGVDLHSFEPTPENILQISKADLFIYVGGESDEWVEKALENPENKNRKVVNMLHVLGDKVKAEEHVEGMEEEHHEDADHEEHAEGEEEEEMDEHVWLSLRNASILVQHIADTLSTIAPAQKEMIALNAARYREKLEALDADFATAIVPGKTILFGDRFPFRYLVDDYKIPYFAAFVGCSAETEASFKTIAFLAKKVDELQLKTIFVLESRSHRIAETIRENTKSKDQQILPLHSLQSISDVDLQNGVDYYLLMRQNLEVLKRAL